MCEVKLYFSKVDAKGRCHARLLAIEIRFGTIERRAVTESLASSRGDLGTFRWSRAVRAMSCLMIRSSLVSLDPSVEPRLSGGQGTLAASLDGALSKEPTWLREVFGVFPSGSPVSRRLFARSNPGRKRPGPVAVALAPRVNGADIRIYLNGVRLVSQGRLYELLGCLECLPEPTV